jgi:hypothetical protein
MPKLCTTDDEQVKILCTISGDSIVRDIVDSGYWLCHALSLLSAGCTLPFPLCTLNLPHKLVAAADAL